jgi:hypothetical protein
MNKLKNNQYKRSLYLVAITFLSLFSITSFAQKLSQQDIGQVNNTVYESLVKENSVKFVRKTKEGTISSCDLEYQYAYRDFNAKGGAPVLVQGAFSFMYNKGKNPGFLFKLAPAVGDVTTQKWTIITPPYADVFASGKSIKQFIVADFVCENNGKCIAYSDKEGTMATILFDKVPFDIEIKFSLSKGGVDNSFTLSSLLPKDKYIAQAAEFMNCNVEIINKISSDIKEMTKKK